MLAEYKRLLNSNGQPGVGDAYYLHVLRHLGDGVHTDLIALQPNDERKYEEFPRDERLRSFDQSDRKFAVAASIRSAAVLNAVDSDWLEHRVALAENGIRVEFVCGEAAATKKG